MTVPKIKGINFGSVMQLASIVVDSIYRASGVSSKNIN